MANEFNALEYWGKLAIKLTKENIKLKQELTMMSIERLIKKNKKNKEK